MTSGKKERAGWLVGTGVMVGVVGVGVVGTVVVVVVVGGTVVVGLYCC